MIIESPLTLDPRIMEEHGNEFELTTRQLEFIDQVIFTKATRIGWYDIALSKPEPSVMTFEILRRGSRFLTRDDLKEIIRRSWIMRMTDTRQTQKIIAKMIKFIIMGEGKSTNYDQIVEAILTPTITQAIPLTTDIKG